MSSLFEVRRNNIVGRFVVASHDMEPGTEILREEPLMLGPKSGSRILCLSCYKPLPRNPPLCSKCKWPICGRACEEGVDHMKECKLLTDSGAEWVCPCPGNLCPQMECISPLRLLLAKDDDPQRWKEEVEPLLSHCKMRESQNHFDWSAETVNIVNYLRNACKLSKRWSEEDIHRACGLLEVNSYEVVNEKGQEMRGLYPFMAIFSHSCVANTIHTVFPEDNYRMAMRTTVKVNKGEELFTSYVSSLTPTILRRDFLKKSKYFDCHCRRCSDPKELGTLGSDLKCPNCIDGNSTRLLNPQDPMSVWVCNSCGREIGAKEVKKILYAVNEEICRIEGLPFGPEKLISAEQALLGLDEYLGPTNCLRSSLWLELVKLYGSVSGYTLDILPYQLLKRKSQLCSLLLDILDIVEPGMTRIRGRVLYEKGVTEVRMQGEVSINQLKGYFKEAIECLSREPHLSPSSMIALKAKNYLKAIDVQQLNDIV